MELQQVKRRRKKRRRKSQPIHWRADPSLWRARALSSFLKPHLHWRRNPGSEEPADGDNKDPHVCKNRGEVPMFSHKILARKHI
jgi:hypothetical protein